MKLMVGGTWHGDVAPTPELDAQRMIHAGRFRDRITSDHPNLPRKLGAITSMFRPLARSRTASWSCALKRLETVVGLSVLHPLWDTPDGWVFGDTGLSTVDRAGNGFRCLYEAYGANRRPTLPPRIAWLINNLARRSALRPHAD